MRRKAVAALLLVFVTAGMCCLLASRRAGSVPVQGQVAGALEPKAQRHRRSLLAFSSFDDNNILHRRGWYAVWCYLPNASKQTVFHPRSTSVYDWTASQSTQDIGREWATINGGYFARNPRKGIQPVIGSVGSQAKWHHGLHPARHGQQFQRWAFGFQNSFRDSSDFGIALMQQRHGATGYSVPADLEQKYSAGLSGLLCLLKDGQPLVWRDAGQTTHLEPLGQWDGDGEFMRGYYRRALVAWTDDARHLLLIVQHHPRDIIETRDLVALYQQKQYLGAGEVLRALHREYSLLPPEKRPCSQNELPQRIENAMLLDGGHSASLIYRRLDGYDNQSRPQWVEHGSWLTGTPSRREEPLVPTMISVIED